MKEEEVINLIREGVEGHMERGVTENVAIEVGLEEFRRECWVCK